jgi:hypothetical protein
MSNQDEINSIERDVKDAKEQKALGTALERLITNRDFQKVIKAGYFEAEAVRLVHAKGDPACQTPEKQASIIRQIDSISNLNQYFQTVLHMAGLAEKSVQESEAILEELRAEGGE